MRFAELVNIFDTFNRVNKRPRTADFYRDHLAKVVRAYGELDAAELRPWHLLAFKSTWHLCLAVQRVYRWAVDEQDILPVNPMAKLRRPRLGARRRVLGPAELARLLRGARPDFRQYLLFARESAARPQELSALRWDHLQWEGGAAELPGELGAGRACFVLMDYKGRARRADATAPRIIPITPRLGRALVRMLAGHVPEGLVLTAAGGRAWNRNSLRMRLRRLMGRVKVAAEVNGERVVCYTLRHSAATSLASRGLQTSVLQGLLGHSNIKTTQRYIHLHRRQLLQTWRDFWQRRPEPGEK